MTPYTDKGMEIGEFAKLVDEARLENNWNNIIDMFEHKLVTPEQKEYLITYVGGLAEDRLMEEVNLAEYMDDGEVKVYNLALDIE